MHDLKVLVQDQQFGLQRINNKHETLLNTSVVLPRNTSVVGGPDRKTATSPFQSVRYDERTRQMAHTLSPMRSTASSVPAQDSASNMLGTPRLKVAMLS